MNTDTHMMRTARQEQSKEKQLEKLLRNSRAVLDVFRSGKESALQERMSFLWFELFDALPALVTFINPWRILCSKLPGHARWGGIYCVGCNHPTTQTQRNVSQIGVLPEQVDISTPCMCVPFGLN